MRSPAGFRSVQVPVPDGTLIRAIRDGRSEAFRDIYRRHYPAVNAYASQCVQSPLDAYDLTCQAFADLLQRIWSGESCVERRFPGCLRLALLTSVRCAAVVKSSRDSGAASPRFRQWVAQGARWPMEDNGQLGLAWENLPRTMRCLLWHTTPDLDDLDLVSLITGIASEAIAGARADAMNALRRTRADLYLERLGPSECREAVGQLMSEPSFSGSRRALRHAGVCAGCRELFNDVIHSDARLRTRLPWQLLGWWPGAAHLDAKAAIPVPEADPPFLSRTTLPARATTRPQRSARKRGPLSARPRTALAVTAFAIGLAVGYTSYPVAVPDQVVYEVPRTNSP
jgi:hypothetical protein